MAPVLTKPLALAIGVAVWASMKKKKPKRKWSKNWLMNRSKYTVVKLLNEIRMNEPRDYFNYLRMDNELFQKLLGMFSFDFYVFNIDIF